VPDIAEFLKPAPSERLFNQAFGWLLRFGIGLSHNYLLEVRGRKSGRLYSTPVDVLDMSGRQFLVCGRGQSQWVRNAQVAGRVMLVRGGKRTEFAVPAGSPVADFESIAQRYPVFELVAAA
jgi:F420H(2)-dependent quinone reductase